MKTLKCVFCTMAGLVLAFMLTRCGDTTTIEKIGKNGKNGVAGSNSTVPGEIGPSGSAGVDGVDAVIQIVYVSSCANGGYTLLTATDTNPNGFADALDSNFQSIEICNGLNGTDGQNGIAGEAATVELVNPCGVNTTHDEQFLKLPSVNGFILLASFSNNINGDYTRFSVLKTGISYLTTDGDNCHFDVAADGYTLQNQHH